MIGSERHADQITVTTNGMRWRQIFKIWNTTGTRDHGTGIGIRRRMQRLEMAENRMRKDRFYHMYQNLVYSRPSVCNLSSNSGSFFPPHLLTASVVCYIELEVVQHCDKVDL
jgi:hypothetical protein